MKTAKFTLTSTILAAAFGLALGLMSTSAQAHCPHKNSIKHFHSDAGGTLKYSATLTLGGFEFASMDLIANSLVEPLSIAAVERQLRARKAALQDRLQTYINQNPKIFDGPRPPVTAIWGITVVARQSDAYRVRVTFEIEGQGLNTGSLRNGMTGGGTLVWILTLRLENNDIRIVDHTLA